ncbi:lantibiotic immunity ABC transporter MutE/EpiE family permease subunit [Oceanobacillus piezotolerans]|uniref:Lantibiotic immunity ABC transporter MutE/EpiE family permease subunit n=1 Tax=Oceanobacillus piezotolerans TaxID=2448030 RepID=A0A498DCY7_9BACI|nr:lantibiotic immunity ABC transporter MutE/EpiE family permease subunit [Oceanobacillus piezotolerans]RLL40112.1 lantibiotic immunity ABC transporter MutE/EpiE family permease subunit [Oceanobacillus piezotolerans]
MIEYLKAERLKMKGSISIQLLLFIPLFFWLFAIYTSLFVTESGSFNAYLALIFNQWPLVFLPIGQAIACSINISLEKKSGNYKSIISNNLSLSRTWYSKIINMVGYQLLSSIIIIVISVGGSLFTFNEMPNVLNIIYTTLLITLAFLPLLPFNFVLSQYFGTIITVITNLFGALISVVWLAPYSTFWLTPWGNMLRIPAATMGIHPNGTQIEPGSPLLDSSVLGISIVSSFVYFVLLSILFTVVFKKKVME